MLNAHTATRTFREMQFDTKAFLKALYDVMPAEGHEDKGLVEIKWADGSVDIVPTFELIRSICNSTYMQLLIGGVAELIPEHTSVPVQNGKYYRDTMKLLIQSAPLKAPMREIGSAEEDLQIIGGVINELVANDVTLPYDAEISRIEVNGSLTTSYCESDDSHIGNMLCEDGHIKRFNDKVAKDPTLNLSNLRVSVPVQVIAQYRNGYDLSQWTQIGLNTVIRPVYYVTGQFRFGEEQTEIDWYRLQLDGAGINVAIPILTASISFKDGVSLKSEYVRTEFTKFRANRKAPLPLDSPPSITMLYPLKETKGYKNGHVKITLLPPTENDNNMVITVQNLAETPVTACNAWAFSKVSPKVTTTSRSTSFGSAFGLGVVGAAASIGASVANSASSSSSGSSSDDYDGEVEALNYIRLPAYSAVDFLFKWSLKSKDRWEAYMLPMSSVDLSVKKSRWF